MTRPSRPQAGMTLIELLIAMSIGLVLTGAVVQALVFTSQHYRRAEAIAQMQEHADVALRFLVADLRMAGHWGLAGSAAHIDGRALAADDNPRGLRLPAQCANALATRLAFPVEAHANSDDWGCAPDIVPRSDGLVVRFASAAAMSAQAGRLQVDSAPLTARLIDDGVVAAHSPATLHDLQVVAYYVAPYSSVFPDQPVLKRMTLSATTRGPLFIDEEITAGIESFQVTVDVDSDGDGVADRTLQAGDPALFVTDASDLPLLTPLAVRVMLIVRSENAGWRKVPARRFRLADLDWLAPADGYLRLDVSTSVHLRNPALP